MLYRVVTVKNNLNFGQLKFLRRTMCSKLISVPDVRDPMYPIYKHVNYSRCRKKITCRDSVAISRSICVEYIDAKKKNEKKPEWYRNEEKEEQPRTELITHFRLLKSERR